MNRDNKKLKAASFSIAVNVFLIVMKAAVAVLTGSIAILAELAHSALDMIASIFAYAGIRKADEPADHTHNYGHEKFENLSSLAQTILIFVTSIFIIYEAVHRLDLRENPEFIEVGLIIMIITIIIDFFISRYLHRASKEYESSALEADAYHFTTDLWSAMAVIIGLGFVLLGIPVFDAIAAMVVAVLMLWISLRLGIKSINVLTDKVPSGVPVEKIEKIINETPGVENFHKLKIRQAGNKLYLDVHIRVSPDLTVIEGHKIAHSAKNALMKNFPSIKDVNIHIEPK